MIVCIFCRVGKYVRGWNSRGTFKMDDSRENGECASYAPRQMKLQKRKKKRKLRKKPSVQVARKDDSPTRPLRSQTNLNTLQSCTWSIKATKRKSSRTKMKWKQEEEEEVNASLSSSTATPSSSIPEINFVYNVRAFSILFNQYEPSSIE